MIRPGEEKSWRTVEDYLRAAEAHKVAVSLIVSPYLRGARIANYCEGNLYISQAIETLIADAMQQDKAEGTGCTYLYEMASRIPLRSVTVEQLPAWKG